MKYIISIKRQKDASSKPITMTYEYESDGKESIATMLEKLNETLNDPISWQCSCLQKKCGACAMIINGIPRLACSTFLKDLKKKIKLEPLSKFPVVKDLIVDRSFIFDQLKDMRIWTEDENKESDVFKFKAASCLMCGCCLEICPNFSIKDNHIGAIGVMAAYRSDNTNSKHSNEIKQAYVNKFYNTCGKSFSCINICPIGLPIEELMVKNSKLVNKLQKENKYGIYIN